METQPITEAMIWDILQTVPDPEIPVVSVVDMGIIQSIAIGETGTVHIQMTPTFAGCPAIAMMQQGIQAALEAAGIGEAQVDVVFAPAWTSDRIGEHGRRKLAEFGLAPPPPLAGRGEGAVIMLMEQIACPFCNSTQTHLESPFGPTLCRAIYYCDSCQQPFELFKPL
jgi:ring-1,2-phenylacetyl-CoA epoxidase subunit PaaD